MPKEQSPDARELAQEPLPKDKFPGRSDDYRVFLDGKVHEGIAAHAAADTSVEIGGVLIGHWAKDDDGPFLVVSDFLRCDAATSRSGEVTFTHEAWNDIHREMDTRFADKKIVGWYHSHPNFGIFLSERDRFIQQHFFGNPGQVAYVVDPLRKLEGLFVWKNGKIVACPHYWAGRRVIVWREEGETPVPSGGRTADSRGQAPEESLFTAGAVRSAMIYLLVFLTGCLVASVRGRWEQQMLVEGALTHYGIWKSIKPGFRENMEIVDKALGQMQKQTETLAKQHVALAGDAAEDAQAQWAETISLLKQVRVALIKVTDQYALSPGDEDILRKLILKEKERVAALEKQKEKEKAEPEKTQTEEAKTGE